MSKIIATRAIRGAHKLVRRAEEELAKAIETKGKEQTVAFPDTAYYLPFIYAITGAKIQKLGDIPPIMDHARSLLPPEPAEHFWLPYLGQVLDAGMATLFAEEVIEALKYVMRPDHVQFPWIGFTGDSILREQGIKLVDGRMPGFAACAGACKTKEEAVKIARELQEKSILVFMAGSANGTSMAEQLAEAGIDMNWETFLVPYGKDITAAVHSLNFAARSAMTFGGITPKGVKEARDILLYNKNRVHAFVLGLGEIEDEKYATAAGAINFGFPTVADTDIDKILPTGVCTFEHVVSPIAADEMVNKAIEVRGLKIVVHKIPIPVPYGPGFEGERVRKEHVALEFGGKFTQAFEYLRMRDLKEVENEKIELIGPEIDDTEETKLPLGILVEVAGRKMQKEFESILERRIHTYLSEAHDVMHMNQRDKIWIRIGKEAKKSGLKIKHFGTIIDNRLKADFGNIVDKVQVKLFTKLEEVEKFLPQAQEAYNKRDEVMMGMTDESVDTFYSCQLCQSYAPNHVCIISPERLGLCGTYNWLDGKAAYEVNPKGVNQPVKKGTSIDPVKGQWEGINEFVYAKSNSTIEKFNKYSILEFPETSCLVYDSEVVIDNKITKIGEFIDRHHGTDGYNNSSALTLGNGKTNSEKIVAIQKFPAPKRLIKLIAKSGAELILTPNHKLAVDRPFELSWIRADEIEKGDRIISLRKDWMKKNARKKDYFLDAVTQVKRIDNRDKYEYVYNLTLADTHSYFANSMYIQNCGCFECIVAVIPEANGVMVVHRGFSEMTPIGMTFSTLAGSVGGGMQTPGFIGVGRLFLISKKFISAEGGFHRLVWMPKELKEEMADRLKKRCEELGTPDFMDKVADETIATTSEELVAFLQKVNHPALSMPPLL